MEKDKIKTKIKVVKDEIKNTKKKKTNEIRMY